MIKVCKWKKKSQQFTRWWVILTVGAVFKTLKIVHITKFVIWFNMFIRRNWKEGIKMLQIGKERAYSSICTLLKLNCSQKKSYRYILNVWIRIYVSHCEPDQFASIYTHTTQPHTHKRVRHQQNVSLYAIHIGIVHSAAIVAANSIAFL